MYEKINLIEGEKESDLNKKNKKDNTNCVQPDPKSSTLDSGQSKNGFTHRTIIILNWDKYQSEYLRQKPYRQKRSEKDDSTKDGEESEERAQKSDSKSVTQVTDRGEEIRGEEKRKEYIRGEERRENDSEVSDVCESEPSSSLHSNSNSPSPFNERERNSLLKEEFLSRLRDCPGYPLDEYGDGAYFLYALESYPGIDLLAELDKKISWWQKHPEALKKSGKLPRAQLDEWFEKEYEFTQKRRYS